MLIPKLPAYMTMLSPTYIDRQNKRTNVSFDALVMRGKKGIKAHNIKTCTACQYRLINA